MSMDSVLDPQGVSLSPTQETPSPKVSLSTSSGYSYSLPIRAPPTIDSDFEFFLSTKKKNSTSSYSSGFESEGFVSGEDEFETASERPSVADPDDEIVEESCVVEEFVVTRPFVKDPDDKIVEKSGSVDKIFDFRPFVINPDEKIKESGHVDKNVVSRPFVVGRDEEIKEESDSVEKSVVFRPLVVDRDEETIRTPIIEEDEYGPYVKPAVLDTRILSVPKVGMPIAQLSGDSDDDSMGSEVLEDDGFSGAVRVPGVGVLENFSIAPKVKLLGVEEEEEDESQFEALSETVFGDSISGEVVNRVLVSDEDKGVVEKDSISEFFGDKYPDVNEQAKAESFVASKEHISLENSKFDEAVKYSVEEIQAREDIEHETKCNERSGVQRSSMDLGDYAALKLDSIIQREMVVDCVEDKEVVEDGSVIATEMDKATVVTEYSVESKTLEADKDVDSTNKAGLVVEEMGSEANVVGDVDYKSSRIKAVEVLEQSEDFGMGSDLTIGVNEETTDSKLLGGDAVFTHIVEQSFPPETIEPRLQEVEAEATEANKNAIFGAVSMDNQNSENNGADVNESPILSQGSDDEKLENQIEQNTDWGMESHDSVTAYTARETSESSVMEDALDRKANIVEPASLGSNSDPELKVENKDEADCDPDKLAKEEEGSVSDDDVETLIFGQSDTAKQIIDELEQRLTLASPSLTLASPSGGENSQDHLQGIDGQIVPDSDEEADADGDSEGKQLFDSAALATLLKAATGAGPDGSSVTLASANGSRVFSLEHPAGLSSTFRSLGPTPQPNRPNLFTPLQLPPRVESEEILSEEEKKNREKIQRIQVKFLRLVHRLGRSAEDSIAAQVLFQLVAAGRPSRQAFSLESAKREAMEAEAEGKNDLNFSLNILVIGKTGVGKSATINSIFGEEKSTIDAFEPATTTVKEIVGMIDGVQVRVLDTPGLRSSLAEQYFNRKILSSIKKFTKKCPPDVVLYVDRVDSQTRDLNDLPLLRSITNSLGSSIWDNAIVTLTHATSIPPDGPSGSPLSYDVFAAQQSRVVQQLISHVVGGLHMMNSGLMNPVSLVENHSLCKKKLPNGESWRPQLLLLCYSIKILSEANSVVKTKDPLDHKKHFGFRILSPPLPYFLSSLLQSYAHPKLSPDQGGDDVDSDIEVGYSSDSDEDDEESYDQLPPFKPLRKSEIAKLRKEQRKAYFEEYDYRVKFLQKKQWREDVKRLREMKKKGKDGANDYGYMEELEDQENGSPAALPVTVPLPDTVLPPSFDGDNPAYRYRLLEPTSHLITRPVLNPQVWDHDSGYDSVSLEESLAIAGRFPAVVAVQLTKDKKEFDIHIGSSVSAKHGENGSTMAGLNIQTIGTNRAYILKGETKLKNFKINKTAAGVSITFLGENVVAGLKVEDQLAVGKRLVLVGSTGALRSQGDVAYGANLEVRLREKDFPIGQEQASLVLSLVRWREDVIWGCNLQSQFSVGQCSKMVLRAGLNNKKSGQISIRTSSSDQLQIALVGLLPIARAIFRSIFPQFSEKY